MRCSCKVCDTYMIQAESAVLGCVCPECGYRCTDCLGTDTVVPRDRISSLALDPRFSPESLEAAQGSPEEEDDRYGEEDIYYRDGGY